jgi:hypothetical protein
MRGVFPDLAVDRLCQQPAATAVLDPEPGWILFGSGIKFCGAQFPLTLLCPKDIAA